MDKKKLAIRQKNKNLAVQAKQRKKRQYSLQHSKLLFFYSFNLHKYVFGMDRIFFPRGQYFRKVFVAIVTY